MWIVLFILALLFVLGGALILLRSAKTSKIPDNVKSQPYDEDDSGIWSLLSVSQLFGIIAGVYPGCYHSSNTSKKYSSSLVL